MYAGTINTYIYARSDRPRWILHRFHIKIGIGDVLRRRHDRYMDDGAVDAGV